MRHNVIIAAGGSGGHVLPAQTVAGDLQKSDVTVTFAAFGLQENSFFDRSHNAFYEITAAPPSASFKFLSSTTKGLLQSIRLLRKERPSLVIGFGSYHVFPLLAAASLLRVPFVLYAADVVPGRAIRLFAPLARWTGCFFEEAATKIRGKTVHVDFPLRPSLRCLPSKEEGCQYFGVQHDGRTILVLGGSQGAAALNSLLPQAISQLSPRPTVIHLAGKGADINALAHAYHTLAIQAEVRAYERAMHYAFAAADVVVARAGASTIAEVEMCHKPALYVPFPHAMDDHQMKNAQQAAARGRAIVIGETDATYDTIAHALHTLLEPSPQKCEYHRKPSMTFVSKILQTLDEVSPCQRR